MTYFLVNNWIKRWTNRIRFITTRIIQKTQYFSRQDFFSDKFLITEIDNRFPVEISNKATNVVIGTEEQQMTTVQRDTFVTPAPVIQKVLNDPVAYKSSVPFGNFFLFPL